MLKEILTRGRHLQSSSGCNIEQVIHENALSGRYPDIAKHFYSNAQHACIASFLAEDIYGMEVAQAIVPKIFAERSTGYVSLHILDAFPEIAKTHDAVCQQLFNHFGIDAALIRSREVDYISRLMLAIEHRDILQGIGNSEGLPDPLPEVAIAPMSSRRAKMALTLRIKDVFPSLDQDRLDRSLLESLVPRISVMEKQGC